jgi:hypothetical protein
VADAVLVIADIEAGIFPTHCVRTGESTTSATHVWAVASPQVVALFGAVGVAALRALRRPALRVPLPVAARPFGIWRRRAAAWAVVTCFGIGTIVMSVRNGDPALAVIGTVVLAASVAGRRRSHGGFWVSAELRPSAGHVVIRRAHPQFDADARRLFLRRR